MSFSRFSLAFLAGLAAAAAGVANEFSPAIVYDFGGKFDRSFNQSASEGAQKFKADTGIAYREFEITNAAQREQIMAQLARRGATIIVAVPVISDPHLAVAVLSLASMGYGVYTSSHWAATQTIAGPAAAGRWTGLQNFTGNLAGVVAPIVTGAVVQATGHYFWAFAATSAVVLTGSLALAFGLGPVEPVAWALPSVPTD